MRTVNKFIFTGLFFVLAVCAFAQAQDSIVHADTTVITAQDVTVAPPDSLKAADSLQVDGYCPAQKDEGIPDPFQYAIFR